MPRLIWVFPGHTVILLVLSWGGSYNVYFALELSLHRCISGKMLVFCWIHVEFAHSKKYRKNPKISDIQKIFCNHPKSWTRWLFLRVMHPKDAAEIANSVDPDQTAPLIWVCTVCSDLSVQKLRNITVSSPFFTFLSTWGAYWDKYSTALFFSTFTLLCTCIATWWQ